jgi:hypothetical protein
LALASHCFRNTALRCAQIPPQFATFPPIIAATQKRLREISKISGTRGRKVFIDKEVRIDDQAVFKIHVEYAATCSWYRWSVSICFSPRITRMSRIELPRFERIGERHASACRYKGDVDNPASQDLMQISGQLQSRDSSCFTVNFFRQFVERKIQCPRQTHGDGKCGFSVIRFDL